ncbi:type 1 glutamine amidotransferase [Candidatus Poribacteria bacterium]|nr:type 1 glutamine amidotransferase [Candidatus Poribacteria bacterium]
MNIHFLQHVPFEDGANIEVWAHNKGYKISKTLLFNNEKFPEMNSFDWLIIMGGPMNIYEIEKYTWLANEKKFIEKAIANQKIVLGICLGAQLIADVLGAKVTRNKHKEIGWYPVFLTDEAKQSKNFNKIPSEFIAFHWHGDTFEIPNGAIRIAKSKGCENQGFEFNNKVIGLQFHLESTMPSINKLLTNCSEDISRGLYIQSSLEIFSLFNNLQIIEKTMNIFLNNVEKL